MAGRRLLKRASIASGSRIEIFSRGKPESGPMSVERSEPSWPPAPKTIALTSGTVPIHTGGEIHRGQMIHSSVVGATGLRPVATLPLLPAGVAGFRYLIKSHRYTGRELVELFREPGVSQQEGGDLAFGGRPPDQESLRRIASRFDQHRFRGAVLEALSDDPQTQVVPEPDRRAHDGA